MQRYGIGEQELRFARLLWERGKMRSAEAVKLAEEHLGWKKSTTYTMLRRLCQHGLFRNERCMIIPVMNEEEYKAMVGTDVIVDKFDGSLPAFLAAFTKRSKLTEKEKKELLAVINASGEEK